MYVCSPVLSFLNVAGNGLTALERNIYCNKISVIPPPNIHESGYVVSTVHLKLYSEPLYICANM